MHDTNSDTSNFTQNEGKMMKRLTLLNVTEESCRYFLSDECYGSLVGKCIGGDVNRGRLKRESQTAVIYQYPYEFEYKNAGRCWVQEGMLCDHFERFVLPDGNEAIDEEYEKCVSGIKKQKLRFCECGAELAKRARYCEKCRKKRRRRSDKENHRKRRV